jgi:hypothetical protein
MRALEALVELNVLTRGRAAGRHALTHAYAARESSIKGSGAMATERGAVMAAMYALGLTRTGKARVVQLLQMEAELLFGEPAVRFESFRDSLIA